MFDRLPDLPTLALLTFSSILVILRTWVEIRDLRNEWRARKRQEEERATEAREPPSPSPPFDPVAYEARRQQLLANGWKEWASGIFTQDARPVRRGPPEGKHAPKAT